MSNTMNLRNVCEEAVQLFDKLNVEAHNEIKSKLQYCIGSFDYDQNPSGLYEFGEIALEELKSFKEANPRKVTKKMIDSLEKSLKK